MQSCTVLFLLLTGCVTTSTPEINLDAWIPEGMYHVRAPTINQDNLAKVTHEGTRIRVSLLGTFDGGFSFAPQEGGRFEIVDAEMDYPGLKRSFKGEGQIREPGVASGECVMWLKSAGPVSRNHRKGPWFLRPATQEEIQRYSLEQKQLRARKERAAGGS